MRISELSVMSCFFEMGWRIRLAMRTPTPHHATFSIPRS
jgi:hypothetical protein